MIFATMEQCSVLPLPLPTDSITITLIATTFLTLYLLYFLYLRHEFRGPVTLWPILGAMPGLFHNRNRLHDRFVEILTRTGPKLTYQTCSFSLPYFATTYGLYTLTCHPKNIEHILKTRFDNYPKGPVWQESFYDLLGEGIFNSDGDGWRKQRKAAAPEFCTRTLRQALDRWVKRSIKNRLWPILEEAASRVSVVDMQDLLLRLTFDNICGLTFGMDPETLSPGLPEAPFAKAFQTATEITLQRLIYTPVVFRFKKRFNIGDEKELEKSLKILDNYMSDVLDECERSPSDDLLSRFIKLRGIERNYASNSDLKRIAMNFLLAGRDTSSVAMSWFFWLIMNHPAVEDMIVNEIKHVLRKTRGIADGVDMMKWVQEPLEFDEADKLVYLKAALSESLRLYPSVPEDFKYVLKDDVLPDGTKVTAGSNVIYSIYAMGRMKEIWGEDCMEFKPERWLVRIKEGEYRFEPPNEAFKFVAFNAGPRICLGKDLAYLQMKCVTSAVLLRYRLSLVPDHRIEQKMALTLFMKHGLKVYVHPRDMMS